MKSFAIQLQLEGAPAYYSLRAARDLGSPSSWTVDRDTALEFVHREDAQAFVDRFLPHQAPNCSIVPHTERTA